jgi:hypothetical protein
VEEIKASPPDLLSEREEAEHLYIPKHYLFQIFLMNITKHIHYADRNIKMIWKALMLIYVMKYRSLSIGEGVGG